MDRELLFRGKRIDNGNWVEGHYFKNENGTFIFTFPYHANYAGIDVMVKVDPKTVCQYTSLKDKNGRKIFEGDIVNCHEKRGAAFWHCKVVWNEVKARFDVIAMDCSFPMCLDEILANNDISIDGKDYEVISNIFDEPKCDGCKCRNCFSKSECCPQCEGAILGCEEYSETDIYKPDFSEGGAE